jgi:hypothetical protein
MWNVITMCITKSKTFSFSEHFVQSLLFFCECECVHVFERVRVFEHEFVHVCVFVHACACAGMHICLRL